MKYKTGGGNKLQPYSKYSGRYVESDLSQLIGEIVSAKLFGLKNIDLSKFPFPKIDNFSKEYCEIYIKYIFKGNFYIHINKITKYLLVFKKVNDKSGWLRGHGYSLSNYKELENDIINHSSKNKLVFEEINEYEELIFSQIIQIPERNNLLGKVIWKIGPKDTNLSLVTFKRIKEKNNENKDL